MTIMRNVVSTVALKSASLTFITVKEGAEGVLVIVCSGCIDVSVG